MGDGLALQACSTISGTIGYDALVKEVMHVTRADEVHAHHLLRLVSRTVSGGTAFECVHDAFQNDLVVIAPDSKEAEPLRLVCINDVTLLRAHLRFRVQPETWEGVIAQIDAIFIARVDRATSASPDACVIMRAQAAARMQ